MKITGFASFCFSVLFFVLFSAQAQANVCSRTSQIVLQLEILTGLNCDQIENSHLAKIVDLDLEDKDIKQIISDDFAGLSSIVELSLNNNVLQKIPSNSFKGMTSLEKLELGRNKINLGVGVFDSLTSLIEA